MPLEAKIELLTAAVIELTAAIGAMQAPGKFKVDGFSKVEVSDAEIKGAMGQAFSAAEELSKSPNEVRSSTDTTSGQQSAPTGESSSPELDYAKDVKPITLRLSKEKGREVTIAVLQRFGVKGAQELDKAQWADYIAHCDKVLAGGEV